MRNAAAWCAVCLLSLITACLLAAPNFPVAEMLAIMLLGAMSLLISFHRGESPRFFFYSHQIAAAALIFLGYEAPGLWAGLMLLAFNLREVSDFYIFSLTLILPFLHSELLLPILLLYAAILLTVCLSRLSRAYEKLKNDYYKTFDQMTTERLRLESERRKMQTAFEMARENEILAERNRIAREIHDNVGHQLTAAILQTAALELGTEGSEEKALGQLKENLETALEDIRASVHQLHAESLNLSKALAKLSEDYSFCPVYIQTDFSQEPEAPVHHAIIAICREALANTARHSNADRVDISFRQGLQNYQLLIVDNGSQKRKNASFSLQDGIGLYNMEDRVRQLGGQINLSQERGFRIFVRIPLSEKQQKGGPSCA